MIEPKNAEERKALRLVAAQLRDHTIEGFSDALEREQYLAVLAEARAIVREEQGNTRSRSNEDELEIVRAGISFIHVAASTLSLVAQWDETETERRILKSRLLPLLSRERELMAKSEPEGGK